MKVYVMSTAVIPPNFRGEAAVYTFPPEEIRRYLRTRPPVDVVSYCASGAIAEYLNVDVCKDVLDGATLSLPCILVGIRPMRRLEPGEEMEVTEGPFQGFLIDLDKFKVKAW